MMADECGRVRTRGMDARTGGAARLWVSFPRTVRLGLPPMGFLAMPIPIDCECGMRSTAPDEGAGKFGRCPRCRARILIPFPTEPVVSQLMFCTDCETSCDAQSCVSAGCPVCHNKKDGSRRRSFTGKPGEVWENTTSKFVYQMVVNRHTEYGPCYQFWGHIGDWWPIPFVKGCLCTNKPIRPGERSLPFPDLELGLGDLDEGQQDDLMGRNNWLLFSSGIAKWSDITSPTRVRKFHEVVAIKRITVSDMILAGVTKADADATWSLLHTPDRQARDAKRAEILVRLRAAGMTDQQISQELASRLLGGLGIGRKPNE
jgi:hypothetical protein